METEKTETPDKPKGSVIWFDIAVLDEICVALDRSIDMDLEDGVGYAIQSYALQQIKNVIKNERLRIGIWNDGKNG